jgi:hypothetical protein
MNYHMGARYQRGRGIGSLFSGLIRGFAPIARMGLNFGKRALTSDLAKNIAGQALDSGKKIALNMAADLLEGKNVKDSAQEQLDEAKKNIATTLRGGGCRKRKRNNIRSKTKKRRLTYNLLDDDE